MLDSGDANHRIARRRVNAGLDNVAADQPVRSLERSTTLHRDQLSHPELPRQSEIDSHQIAEACRAQQLQRIPTSAAQIDDFGAADQCQQALVAIASDPNSSGANCAVGASGAAAQRCCRRPPANLAALLSSIFQERSPVDQQTWAQLYFGFLCTWVARVRPTLCAFKAAQNLWLGTRPSHSGKHRNHRCKRNPHSPRARRGSNAQDGKNTRRTEDDREPPAARPLEMALHYVTKLTNEATDAYPYKHKPADLARRPTSEARDASTYRALVPENA